MAMDDDDDDDDDDNDDDVLFTFCPEWRPNRHSDWHQICHMDAI